MMTKKTCQNRFKCGDVQLFLNSKNTATSRECFTYWEAFDPPIEREIEISDEEFQGAYRIFANGIEAFNQLLKKSLNGVSCQSVFANWSTQSATITFWMKDLG